MIAKSTDKEEDSRTKKFLLVDEKKKMKINTITSYFSPTEKLKVD